MCLKRSADRGNPCHLVLPSRKPHYFHVAILQSWPFHPPDGHILTRKYWLDMQLCALCLALLKAAARFFFSFSKRTPPGWLPCVAFSQPPVPSRAQAAAAEWRVAVALFGSMRQHDVPPNAITRPDAHHMRGMSVSVWIIYIGSPFYALTCVDKWCDVDVNRFMGAS